MAHTVPGGGSASRDFLLKIVSQMDLALPLEVVEDPDGRAERLKAALAEIFAAHERAPAPPDPVGAPDQRMQN